MKVLDHLKFIGRKIVSIDNIDGHIEQDALRLLEEGSAFEKQGQFDKALLRFDAALVLSPTLGPAYFYRGNVLLEQGKADKALISYEKAIEIKPDSAAAHYNKGNACIRLGLHQVAVKAYQTALSLKPEFVDAKVALGVALEELGQLEDAAAHYCSALKLKPNYVEVQFNLGRTFQKLGEHEKAMGCYRQAIQIGSEDVQLHFNLGMMLNELELFDESIESYLRVLEIKPDYIEAYNNLGGSLKEIGQLDEAVEIYQRALEMMPNCAEILNNLGAVLRIQGKLNEAIACYQRGLEVKPNFPELINNLGTALKDLGQLNNALTHYQRSIEIKPDFAEAHYNLGLIFQTLWQSDNAINSYRRALKINPNHADSHNNLGAVLKDCGDMEAALVSIRRALEINPEYSSAHSNLLFIQNYMAGQSPSQLLAEAQRFGEVVARLARPYNTWSNSAEVNRCLRIGLVSGDLGDHPVGFFVDSVLSALAATNADRLEIFVYSNRFCSGEINERLKACCRRWYSAVGVSDKVLAQRIHEDTVDILIDLSGHTGLNRLPVFAWKPAPIQVSWLGYFATTGVTAIDYLIADPWTLPPSEEPHFTEAIWRLPETRLCFTPPNVAVDVSALPALNNGYLTFGCFNNLSKMNEDVVALWARVLTAVPNSRLLLKAPQLNDDTSHQDIAERFVFQGIESKRIILERPSPRADYLAAYQRVDIALDPFPYPGGTTTVEALWMGVPVLTLTGERFLARQGVGLLMNAGLPDWVATDPDDYVARAVAHASDLQRLAALRSRLRAQVLASPIFDAPRFAKHFESALRDMWKIWCEK